MMRRYLIHRFLISLITIWLIATVCFFMLRLLPGNPFATGALLSAETIASMMRYYGMDQPLWKQYVTYMTNLLQGDFGYSLKYAGRSVNTVIQTTFPVSAQLGMQALIFGVPVGVLLGIVSARKRNSVVDHMLNGVSVMGIAVPVFIIAVLLQYFVALKLGWLPVAQWKSFAHTILPTITLSFGTIAGYTRAMRTFMLEIHDQEYLKTARAKGLGETRIVLFHQIRNALLPLITGLGTQIAGMLMGSYIVEQIFAIPGMGAYFVNAIQSLDYTMVLGLVVFQAVLIVFANFIVDLLYVIVDPRVRIT